MPETLSSFGEKDREPTAAELRAALGRAHGAWSALLTSLRDRIDSVTTVWGFAGPRYGWSLRVYHRERVLVYLTPQRGRALVSFALGPRAVRAARAAKLPPSVLGAIAAAPRYAEGTGVRFLLTGRRQVASLARLARIKRDN
jgi:hypothetical protein